MILPLMSAMGKGPNILESRDAVHVVPHNPAVTLGNLPLYQYEMKNIKIGLTDLDHHVATSLWRIPENIVAFHP